VRFRAGAAVGTYPEQSHSALAGVEQQGVLFGGRAGGDATI
jgi:hypothetical protein